MLIEKRLALFLNSVKRDSWLSAKPHCLLVGVSGGADSLALLHLLRQRLGPERLVAAHLNHGLRPSAAVEARFVADTAADWGVTCVIEEADVASLARQRGLTVEEAGRDARYQFFARQAGLVGISAVAIAHNADDQAETVLMHLMRGAGLAGLRGMLPVAQMPGAPHLTLIRPLLRASRAEIEAYCRKHRLQPIEDLSNQDTSYFRNWLRHQLLPLMQQHNPQIKRHLQNTAQLVAADYAFMEEQVRHKWPSLLLKSGDEWLYLDPAGWQNLSLSMQRALLRYAVNQLRPNQRDVSSRAIEHARRVIESGQVGAKATLPAGLLLTIGYKRIGITGSAIIPDDAPQLIAETPMTLPIPGRVELAHGWCIDAQYVDSFDLTQVQHNPDPWLAYINPSDQPLNVRSRRPGERFQPLGMRGKSVKVKEVMINRKIEAALRPAWPLVTNRDHLIWLVGHHIDQRVKIATVGRRIVRLRCHRPAAGRQLTT